MCTLSLGSRLAERRRAYFTPDVACDAPQVSFVDLAGSERMRDARNADESQMREASGINRSLFTLGKVAARLAGDAVSCRPRRSVAPRITYRECGGLRSAPLR